ncbi:hypothetical protein FQN60_014924 [Etheostoma spectabile]|uniref:Uncharacterized protein n=1 Tax=Etheostoma spectabile TaxID=54343 RepID=A0A5J5CSR6_9PERO|nr:hypothetical protein FQN60_014924 [Etheostoma spectabile]
MGEKRTDWGRSWADGALLSVGYMQSTISWICDSSRFFMKSLSKMASLIRSLDLETRQIKIITLQTALEISGLLNPDLDPPTRASDSKQRLLTRPL